MTSLPLVDEKDFVAALHQTQGAAGELVSVVRAARELMLARAEKNLEGNYKKNTCAVALAKGTDFLITVLFDFLHAKDVSKDKPTLLAVGGYGANHLAPFSDIDLLFLLPRTPARQKTDERSAWIEEMLKILWDSGFKLGYSVRDVKSTMKAAQTDMIFCTSLLDARLLKGEEALFETFQKQFLAAKKTIKPRRFVQAKLNERNYRHEKEGGARFLVEPNVKNSKGGLRDLQTLWWLVKFCYRHGQNFFTDEDYDTLRACEGFLWEVRCRLHFLCSSAQEKLDFQHQPALAEKMGFGGQGPEQVEAFMKYYFLTAKQAGSLTRILCQQLENEQAKAQPRLSKLLLSIRNNKEEKNIKLAKSFVLEGGRLNIEGADVFKTRWANMLDYFQVAALHNLNFHPFALTQIKEALLETPSTLRQDAEANKTFLDILTSRKAPARILRTMNEVGLLGWFVPAFGKIVGQMQFNRYHHYTVDEHLLHAIEKISHLEQMGLPEIKTAKRVANQIGRTQSLRGVLYLALFTHDIAKGQGGDHSELGAVVCAHLAKRFGLSKEHTTLAVWLVDNHLLMSDVAQKRDLSDDKTIRNFVRQVETPQRLQLLFLLTIADILAVGPGTWNGWKAQLLDRLYHLTLAELKAPSSVRRAQLARQCRRALAAALPWGERVKRDYLSALSDRYWTTTNFALQKIHANLWRAWGEKTPLAFSVEDLPDQSVSEVVVITQDHPGLFSRIVGAIAISELHITDAKVFTSAQGLAFDSFSVQTHHETPIGAEHSARLEINIQKVLGGDILPHKEIAQKQALSPTKGGIFKFAPVVAFDNEASDAYSVIEIECLNHPYLLHRLAQKIFREGFMLAAARVATYGERASCAFYIQDAIGHKITDSGKQSHLMKQILQVSREPSVEDSGAGAGGAGAGGASAGAAGRGAIEQGVL